MNELTTPLGNEGVTIGTKPNTGKFPVVIPCYQIYPCSLPYVVLFQEYV